MKDAASTLPGREEEQRGGAEARPSDARSPAVNADAVAVHGGSSAAAPPYLRRRAPIPPLPGACPRSAVTESGQDQQDPPQLLVGHVGSTDELLVGHVGSTDELLVGVYPTDPLKTTPSPLNSARFLLPARAGTATVSRRQLYCVEKQYRVMKQASRCARRPATALIVALTEHRGRLDRACRPPVNAWLRTIEEVDKAMFRQFSAAAIPPRLGSGRFWAKYIITGSPNRR